MNYTQMKGKKTKTHKIERNNSSIQVGQSESLKGHNVRRPKNNDKRAGKKNQNQKEEVIQKCKTQ